MSTGRESVRRHELDHLVRYFERGCSILEVGAGTGFQARELARRGWHVSAVDVRTSEYRDARIFDVREYDGKHLPFPDGTFDIVFSSNVMEHLTNLPALLGEMRRVLKPGGYCVHAMPTPAWCVWTAIGGYADAVRLLARMTRKEHHRPTQSVLRSAAGRLIYRRHGVRGNALTELWWFRAASWRRVFRENGFAVIRESPLGLVYSGYHVLGDRLPLAFRERAARVLGSTCRVYVVRPVQPTPRPAALEGSSAGPSDRE